MTRQRDYVQVAEERAESEARRPLTERLTDWGGVVESDTDAAELDDRIEIEAIEQIAAARMTVTRAALEAFVR